MPCEAERGVAVFVGLERVKQRPRHDGDGEAADEVAAVAFEQRVMRPGHGRARQQQDQRVEERHSNGSKGWMPLGGQTPPRPETARAEKGPEEGREEHHLGGDEQRHAVAQADLHDLGVIAAIDVASRMTSRHHTNMMHEHAEEAEDHQPPAGAVHEHDGAAEQRRPARDRADDRPGAGIDEVIGMLVWPW